MAIEHVVAATMEQLPLRLRRAREKRSMTLSDLAAQTGISTSTLSRLESGHRRPTIELVMLIAMVLEIPLADLVAAPSVRDPRVQLPHTHSEGRAIVPLTHKQSEPRAFKLIIPASEHTPALRTHGGHEWLYVLWGRCASGWAHTMSSWAPARSQSSRRSNRTGSARRGREQWRC